MSKPSSTWDTFHRRADVLRAVVAHADAARDGELPLDLPGVARAFAGPEDLVAALQLRWHTRLSGAVERSLMSEPADLEGAVLKAWRTTARDLAGVRLVLDRQAEAPANRAVADVLDRAARKDRTLLAVMAGRSGMDEAAAQEAGRAIERRARAAYDPRVRPLPVGRRGADRRTSRSAGTGSGGSLVGRLLAALPA